MHLSVQALRELTGYKRPSCQIRWLRENGWPHAVDRTGAPVVAQAEYDRRMLGAAPVRRPEGPRLELVK